MKIAFLYIAEAYQCYHAAAIAHELASRRGAAVQSYYNDPDTPKHLERIRQALGEERIPAIELKKGLLPRALRRLGILRGLQKALILIRNKTLLDDYDAILSVENSAALLKKVGARPKLIFVPHGAGDRARTFLPRIRLFDLVLPAGQKTVARMIDMKLIRPGHYATPGYVKFETAERLQRTARLFANDRPTVFYNPHKAAGLGSWSKFIEPMLQAFEAQDAFNLIVAPHVKMFEKASPEVKRRWEARSTGNILIDTGSVRSVDMSYTMAADIYIGDVSSQVYEFLIIPRPCIFLNAHGIEWEGEPNFAHWRLGEVVGDPADLMQAIRRARQQHALYEERQKQAMAATFGDRQPGAAARAAEAILTFLRDGRV